MTDTLDKLASKDAVRGSEGQIALARGRNSALRMWREEEPGEAKAMTTRSYEVVGYVISGRAELMLEDRKVTLEPGDSWVVPASASHAYRILETFTAIEATTPPA